MIEFQADCGHIIQAPERAAGHIIKCAYCGREVEVPPLPGQERGPQFEALDLNELARKEGHRTVNGLAIQGQQTIARPAVVAIAPDAPQVKPPPFKQYLLAVYSILALGVLALVSTALLRRSGDPPGSAQMAGGTQVAVSPDKPEPAAKPPQVEASLPARTPGHGSAPDSRSIGSAPSRAHRGLLEPALPRGQQGVYVQALSQQADVFIATRDEAIDPVSPGFQAGKANQAHVRSPGFYRVAVRLPADDPWLGADMNGWLRQQSGLRPGPIPQKLLRRDASSETRLQVLPDGTHWLARYYDIEVKPLEWQLITALFFGPGSLDELMAALPGTVHYDIDREDARAALKFENIAEQDHELILNILARIGQVVYAPADGLERLFQIGLSDGLLDIRRLQAEDSADDAADSLSADSASRPGAAGPWSTSRASESSDPPDGSAARQDSNGSRAGPWGAPKGAGKPDGAKTGSTGLAQKIEQYRELLERGETPPAQELRADLQSSGWLQSAPETRLAWIALLTSGMAGSLVEDLGQALLDDPHLDVRLALLGAMVSSERQEAVTFIDRRLEHVDQLPPGDPAVLADERRSLVQARAQLLASRRSVGSRNPWER
jgi:hypothetical protein